MSLWLKRPCLVIAFPCRSDGRPSQGHERNGLLSGLLLWLMCDVGPWVKRWDVCDRCSASEGHASFLQDTMLSSSAFFSSSAFASAVGTRSMEGSKQAELSMLWWKLLDFVSREKQPKSIKIYFFFGQLSTFLSFWIFFWGRKSSRADSLSCPWLLCAPLL